MTDGTEQTAEDGNSRYHHGDLRAVLLQAAEVELGEHGIEGFSLRRVAKRAGVSHAAPAHHFRDVTGLLTALASEGYRRLLAAMEAQAAEATDPRARLTGCALGYVAFAEASPSLFRLAVLSERPDRKATDLKALSDAAFDRIAREFQAVSGRDPFRHTGTMLDVFGVWAIAHGLAELSASGQIKGMVAMTPQARENAILRLVERMVPQTSG